jgi:hypothetical protein
VVFPGDCKKILVLYNKEVMPLGEVVSKTGASSIAKHKQGLFPAGNLPKLIQAESKNHLTPKTDIVSSFLTAVVKTAFVQAIWCMKLSETKTLVPSGVAVINTKQLIVPPGRGLKFT